MDTLFDQLLAPQTEKAEKYMRVLGEAGFEVRDMLERTLDFMCKPEAMQERMFVDALSIRDAAKKLGIDRESQNEKIDRARTFRNNVASRVE